MSTVHKRSSVVSAPIPVRLPAARPSGPAAARAKNNDLTVFIILFSGLAVALCGGFAYQGNGLLTSETYRTAKLQQEIRQQQDLLTSYQRQLAILDTRNTVRIRASHMGMVNGVNIPPYVPGQKAAR